MTSSLIHKGKKSQSSINISNQTPPEPTKADIHQPWNKNVPSKLKSGAAKRRAEKRKKRKKGGRECILKKPFPEHEHNVNLKAPHECSNPEILGWVFEVKLSNGHPAADPRKKHVFFRKDFFAQKVCQIAEDILLP